MLDDADRGRRRGWGVSFHHYPTRVQRSDLIRGGLGLLLTAVPLAVLPMHWVVGLLFAAAAILFAVFTARIILRALTRYESGERGIVAHGPLGTAIAWDELTALKLHFFSTRRDRGNGWMLLVLKCGARTLKLESTLTGFDEIVDRAAETAKAKRLPLTQTTTNNLLAMGAPVADDPPAAPMLSDAASSADLRPTGGEDKA